MRRWDITVTAGLEDGKDCVDEQRIPNARDDAARKLPRRNVPERAAIRIPYSRVLARVTVLRRIEIYPPYLVPWALQYPCMNGSDVLAY